MQPFPTGEGPSGLLGLSEYDMSWNHQPDNVPQSSQIQSPTGQQVRLVGSVVAIANPDIHIAFHSRGRYQRVF